MTYQQFYTSLYKQIENDFKNLIVGLKDALKKWIETDGSILSWNPDMIKKTSDIEYFLCFHFIKHKSQFYNSVKTVIKEHMNEIIEDLINWQRKSIIDLDYKTNVGVIINSKYNWYDWYDNKKWNDNVSVTDKFYRYVDHTIRSDNNLQLQNIEFDKVDDSTKETLFVQQIMVGFYQRKNRLYLKDREMI